MAIKYNVNLRNARLNVLGNYISMSGFVRILTGSLPANCAAAQTGTLLVEIALPASNAMGTASAGVVAKGGTWSGTAVASGTAGYFRIIDGVTCHLQGTAGISGTDMILDGATIASGQVVSVLTFTVTAAGA